MAMFQKTTCDCCGDIIPEEDANRNRKVHQILINPNNSDYTTESDRDSDEEGVEPWDASPEYEELIPNDRLSDKDICPKCFYQITETLRWTVRTAFAGKGDSMSLLVEIKEAAQSVFAKTQHAKRTPVRRIVKEKK